MKDKELRRLLGYKKTHETGYFAETTLYEIKRIYELSKINYDRCSDAIEKACKRIKALEKYLEVEYKEKQEVPEKYVRKSNKPEQD